jgi:hypothetical protein
MYSVVDDPPTNPEIVVLPPAFRRLGGVDVHRCAVLCDENITVIRHVPTTVPALTLLMLGAVAELETVRRAVERAITKRLVTTTALWQALATWGVSGRSGAGTLRAILRERALGDERGESMLEAVAADVFQRYRLPLPKFQFEVFDGHGTLVARIDFAYPELLLAIEVDGWEVHGSPQALTRDFQRQADLEDLGWRVLRFTWFDVVRRPAYVAARIAAALQARIAG